MLTTRTKIAFARAVHRPTMLVRRLFGLDHRARVTRRGITWDLDLNEGIDFSLFLLGGFELKTVKSYRQLIRPGDVVLDIGANIGAHTLELARCVGHNGTVVAFEPTEYAFAKLSKNVMLNKALRPRIRLEQIMLVGRSGESHASELYSSWPLLTTTSCHPDHCGELKTTIGVKAFTLDDYVDRAGLSNIRFIKLDVDGYECGVLRGAQDVLSRHRPLIVMELAPYVLREAGHTIEELLEIITANKYVLLTLQGERLLPTAASDIQQLVPPGYSLNILAKPR